MNFKNSFLVLATVLNAVSATIKTYDHCITPGTIALTFDDGPSLEFSNIIIDILGKYGVKATFFVNDKTFENLKGRNLLVREYNEGHVIGCHPYSYADDASDNLEEDINKLNNAIYDIIGVKPALFRPPNGEFSDASLEILEKCKMTANVLWNLDSEDWHEKTDPIDIYMQILNQSSPETESFIALNHDNQKSTAIYSLLTIIPHIKNLGYKFVTIDECLGVDPYQEVDEPVNETIKEVDEPVNETIEEVDEPVNETIKEVDEPVNETIEEIDEPVNETIEEVDEPVNETIEEVDEPVNETIEEVDEPVNETIEEVDEPVNETIEEVDEPVNEPVEEVEENFNFIKRDDTSTANESEVEDSEVESKGGDEEENKSENEEENKSEDEDEKNKSEEEENTDAATDSSDSSSNEDSNEDSKEDSNEDSKEDSNEDSKEDSNEDSNEDSDVKNSEEEIDLESDEDYDNNEKEKDNSIESDEENNGGEIKTSGKNSNNKDSSNDSVKVDALSSSLFILLLTLLSLLF